MFAQVFSVVALLAGNALSHSWVEQMQLISSNGSYTGDLGYPRGYVARTDPTFNGYADKWQIPSPEHDLGRIRINSTDLLCHPSQRTANYTTQYPKLKVSPDSYVAMRYLENGHVTQPWIPAGKPAGSGTVFVYGTYTPSDTETIVDVLQWTSDGKGGNGKGFLMTAQNYDDDRCRQPNESPISVSRQMADTDMPPGQESWCETDLHIPADVKAGSTLTIYWIWSWQTSTETEGAPCGKDEYYTTCADVDISGASFNVKALFVAPVVHTLVQQEPRKEAVSNYKSRTAFMTAPNLVTTEACSITTITSSVLPASLTQHTIVPAEFLATFSEHPHEQQVPAPTTQPAVISSAAASMPPSIATLPTLATTTVTAVSIETVTYIPPSPTVHMAVIAASSSELTSTSTSTSTRTLTSTTSATTTLYSTLSVSVPTASDAATSIVFDSNGMIGQYADQQGMIGQKKVRRQPFAFTA